VKSIVIILDMHPANLRAIDLNLLGVLEALLDARNVSRAAEALGLSQPAVSHALARLRDVFRDPLFVRDGRGMIPTPRARALQGPVKALLGDVRRLVHPAAFDPAVAEGRFHINAPDATSVVVLANVLKRISRQAPKLDFAITNASAGRFEAMARGDIDLAIDAFEVTPPGFHQEKLVRDRLVCVARVDHPVRATGLTVAAYADWPHANLETASSRMLDRVLEDYGIRRRTALTVPNFITAAGIVAETDWLLTLPSNLAGHLKRMLPLRIHELPFDMPEQTLDQVWHTHADRDPRHAWLRGQIAEIIRENFPPERRRPARSKPPSRARGARHIPAPAKRRAAAR
jgi:DNA-binding transcriptional LysR family regulator